MLGPVADKVLHIYHYDNHYSVICSMPAFFHRSYWCEECNKGFDHTEDHRCSNICRYCFKRNACPLERIIHCVDCNRYFQSDTCYDNHKRVFQQNGAKRLRPNSSVCERYQRCNLCGKMSDKWQLKKHGHQCGYFECNVCQQYVEQIGNYYYY